jgi:hypothetical protein
LSKLIIEACEIKPLAIIEIDKEENNLSDKTDHQIKSTTLEVTQEDTTEANNDSNELDIECELINTKLNNHKTESHEHLFSANIDSPILDEPELFNISDSGLSLFNSSNSREN